MKRLLRALSALLPLPPRPGLIVAEGLAWEAAERLDVPCLNPGGLVALNRPPLARGAFCQHCGAQGPSAHRAKCLENERRGVQFMLR